MFRDGSIVPALMFHSVGLQNHPWAWSYISESLEDFEGKIARLAKAGYHGIFWRDLYDYMAGLKSLPVDSILLTFDDGYLDNWVHVYPVLKKYGMRGTIFVSPDFVDPGSDVRPSLEDVWAGRCSSSELQVAGFLNWPEMQMMERSGVIDIQSHAMTHTWYFTDPRIVDFHRPQAVAPRPWLFWNAKPDRKPYYLVEDQQEYLPWGYPILESKKSLAATRFFPETGPIEKIVSYFEEQGGRAMFDNPGWRTKAEQWCSKTFGESGLPGIYETEQERLVRITSELKDSKEIIEKNLSKSVDYICWPGGANDEAVQRIAESIGYKSWTLDSRSQLGKRNRPGTDPRNIKRMGTSNRIDVKGRQCGSAGPGYQLSRIKAHQGSLFHSALVKVRKAQAFALHSVGWKS